ncbi:hypothetical protein QM027_08350 [Campylobacter concisus]
MVTAVSVIVIACPCALALATPVSSVCALGVAFKNKVLFKEAKFLKALQSAMWRYLTRLGRSQRLNLK